MKIFYDGECYFCRNFAMLLRLRESVGTVELVSLREVNDDTRRILSSGLNVDTGFVVEHDGRIYHGTEAFHYLNTLIEPRNFLSSILFWIGTSELLARIVYPLMVLGRYLLLVIQGGALIGRSGSTCLKAGENAGTDSLGSRTVRIAALLIAIAGIVRCALFGSFPPSTFNLATIAIVTIVTGLSWTQFFLRAEIAQRIYRRIRYADGNAVVIYAILWMALVNAHDLISIRRIVGFAAVFPLYAICIELFRSYRRRADVGMVPAAIPFALMIFSFVPGLYLAPFYGGIDGWTLTIDKSQPVFVSGYKLVNRAGEEIWYNHAFFQPITQDGRFERAFRAGDKNFEHFMQFMLDNYRHIYPTLAKGHLPHQWLLGPLAYPCHNLCDSNASDYIGKFAPDQIVGIKGSIEYYSWNGAYLRTETGFNYHPEPKSNGIANPGGQHS